jgi:hypothetical protein
VRGRRSRVVCLTGDFPLASASLTLLWQILLNGKVIGFPNQFLNDS